jgi:hypothetical protein
VKNNSIFILPDFSQIYNRITVIYLSRRSQITGIKLFEQALLDYNLLIMIQSSKPPLGISLIATTAIFLKLLRNFFHASRFTMFDLIRHELNKLQDLPAWGRPQEDRWDQLSTFVYRIKTLQGVRRQAQAQAKAAGLPVEAFAAYAVRRWFNHHTHNPIKSWQCS